MEAMWIARKLFLDVFREEAKEAMEGDGELALVDECPVSGASGCVVHLTLPMGHVLLPFWR